MDIFSARSKTPITGRSAVPYALSIGTNTRSLVRLTTLTVLSMILTSSAWAFETNKNSTINGELKVTGKLSIGDVNDSPAIDLAIGDHDTGLHQASDGKLQIHSNNAQRMIITNNDSGNEPRIGIGNFTDPQINLAIGDNDTGLHQAEDGKLQIRSNNNVKMLISEDVTFQTNNTKNMVVKNNGNVGIGVADPQVKLHVNGSIKVNNDITVDGSLEFGDNTNINSNIYFYKDSQGKKTVVISDGNFNSNTDNSKLLVNGNIKVFGGVKCFDDFNAPTSCDYWTLSDRRLKSNIQPIESALDKLQQINGVHFDWKDPERHAQESRQVGVIAQDVEAVFPELIGNNQDGYKNVDYSKLSAVLIEAVKELRQQSANLAAQNANLVARLEALEARP